VQVTLDAPALLVLCHDVGRDATALVDIQAPLPGHLVAVLLKVYAHCIDGQATAANQRIADALGIGDAEQDFGDEDSGDTERAS
jgi:hypothetical protein